MSINYRPLVFISGVEVRRRTYTKNTDVCGRGQGCMQLNKNHPKQKETKIVSLVKGPSVEGFKPKSNEALVSATLHTLPTSL